MSDVRVLDLFDLKGQVALVSGSSRGLGLRIADTLGQLGASVALVGRKSEALEQAKQLLSGRGIDAEGFQADLSSADAAVALVEAVVTRFGQIDILVNNAAASWAEPAEDHSLAGWRKVMGVNLEAVFGLTQQVGKREFIPRQRGTILNIASIGGLRGNRPDLAAQTLAYSTSKGGLVNFTRALASEWGQHNINVNALCPGFFHSKMSGELLERIEDRIIEATPLRRIVGDEEFAGAVAFLCSQASRHMTGQMLVVDGGMTAT